MSNIDNSNVYKNEVDVVTKPHHYRSHPSGVECITITEHMTFNVGNAVKYLWRHGLKKPEGGDLTHDRKQIQDLKKSVWYIEREIDRLREIEIENQKNLIRI